MKITPMSLARRITPEKIALLALGLWCVSLALPSLIYYDRAHSLQGFMVLVAGWLGALAFNIAWYANIFFLFAVFRVLAGKTPIFSVISAILLSSQVFFISKIPDANHDHYIYGYGWGAVLWMFSIYFILAAVFVRVNQAAVAEGRIQDERPPVAAVGFLLLLAAGVTLYLSVRDHRIANDAESRRLSGVVFKRGEVCSSADPMVIDPVRSFSGPLEVVSSGRSLRSHPITRVEDLLRWGIPSVRIGAADYAYVSSSSDMVFSTKASGVPAALLAVNGKERFVVKLFEQSQIVEDITVTLFEQTRIVFDFTWKRMQGLWEYCPDYSTQPDGAPQPRKILLDALGLAATVQPSGKREHVGSEGYLPIHKGTIISQVDAESTRAMKVIRWLKDNPGRKDWKNDVRLYNISCPDDVGWQWSESNEDVGMNQGYSFRVGDKSYYLPSQEEKAVCEGNFAYLYQGGVRDGVYYLRVQKRDLVNFQHFWAKRFEVVGIGGDIDKGRILIESIKELPEVISLGIVFQGAGKLVNVEIPIAETH